jgi:hypothetical protein
MLVKIKTIIFLLVCIICFNLQVSGQTVNQKSKEEVSITLSAEQAQLLYKNEQEVKKWIDELQTPGVTIDGNQMTFSKEALRLINEPNYLKQVYKDIYTPEDVKESIMKGEYTKAIWKLIVMYPVAKEQVLQYIYAFDKVMPSDKLVVSAFYTYAFFDPKITSIENGKPVIHRPDIFEEYLRRTKEIMTYIAYFRAQETEKK